MVVPLSPDASFSSTSSSSRTSSSRSLAKEVKYAIARVLIARHFARHSRRDALYITEERHMRERNNSRETRDTLRTRATFPRRPCIEARISNGEGKTKSRDQLHASHRRGDVTPHLAALSAFSTNK